MFSRVKISQYQVSNYTNNYTQPIQGYQNSSSDILCFVFFLWIYFRFISLYKNEKKEKTKTKKKKHTYIHPLPFYCYILYKKEVGIEGKK